jgi:hypothetical protein
MSKDWFLILDPTHDLRKRFQEARARGAYLITHSGVLGRTDGTTFDAGDAQDALTALYWLFAFALGRRTGPALPYGVRKESERPVWAHWAVRATDPIRAHLTWFDRHDRQALGSIFEPFMRLWAEPVYRRILPAVISWHVQAQDINPIETAIVASQIALETLAEYYPLHPELAGPRPFKGAAGRVTRLLRRARIPADIPVEMEALRAVAGPEGWSNGPHAITELRNDLAHPIQRHQWTSEAMYDAWRLSSWYLEMVMLSWLGYSGTYNRRTRDRRMDGLVELVPWAASGAHA